MNIDLSQFEPITELNKPELIQWLENSIATLQDPAYDRDNPNQNRVFGTERDDIDEAIDLIGRVLVTCKNFNFFQKPGV